MLCLAWGDELQVCRSRKRPGSGPTKTGIGNPGLGSKGGFGVPFFGLSGQFKLFWAHD